MHSVLIVMHSAIAFFVMYCAYDEFNWNLLGFGAELDPHTYTHTRAAFSGIFSVFFFFAVVVVVFLTFTAVSVHLFYSIVSAKEICQGCG